MNGKWLIYGAYGYTGKLIVQEAVKRGSHPVIAGRNADKLAALAAQFSLESRAFPLDGSAHEQLQDIDLVLHCAGPFSETSKPMIEACLAAGAHYLDITGEIPVFEYTHAQHERALAANIILCSGVGFDVIPTDCTALKLKEILPDATHLALGFDSDSSLSPGTSKTAIRGLGSGSAVRRDGVIVEKPFGSQHRSIDFGRGRKSAIGIPWGDVATAFYTTSIPNISTWIPMPRTAVVGARLSNILRPVLTSRLVQQKLHTWVERTIHGPDETQRKKSRAYIWGEASNAAGIRKSVRIQVANVYDLTVYGALATVSLVMDGTYPSGSSTPASLFGSQLIETLPGSGKFEIDTFYPSAKNHK